MKNGQQIARPNPVRCIRVWQAKGAIEAHSGVAEVCEMAGSKTQQAVSRAEATIATSGIEMKECRWQRVPELTLNGLDLVVGWCRKRHAGL
ncbi:hypothetical protein RHOFW104T7_00230 [Rhodanobacter thiooxydans]|uniref:Uncharacterized protein n=1 Tax=Rhodanobacter thiooxydans TaxID=416169 RepID=A0A154QFU8_9GAMM|nr:hypothetical protein UUA_17932 [Rhodanobacter thiooxydans LCS2]KZC22531.1 hypothetical protein RHOFW104T7_00230 [Rhodanobacter thiooxydans]